MKFNGRNVYISPKAQLGARVKVGDNTSIYDNVQIGDDSIICDHCVIGEPQNSYYRNPEYQNPPTTVGLNSIIRSHGIIYAGCSIGAEFSSGHWITIREKTVIGDHCSLGTLSDIEGDVTIGSYSRLHSNVHISQASRIGNFVWMFPYSVMTNDPYPPSNDIAGASIGDYSVIGVHAILIPGVKVGQNCLVAAGAVVSRQLPDYSLAKGDPAKIIADVRKYMVMGKGNPYPWMKKFERGMPWQGIGFDTWAAQKEKA